MRRLIRTIILLGILAGIMFFTCPEEEKHIDKLTQELVKAAQSNPSDGETNIIEDLGNAIVGTLGEKAIRLYVQNQLKVENHTILNLGKMKYEGEERVVTIGAFNHVFCLTKAYDMMEELEQN